MTSTTNAMLSGTLAGSLSTLVGAPFDTVKTRLQTSEVGLMGVVRDAVRDRRLFNGTSPALVSAVLENSVVFGANAALKSVVGSGRGHSLAETAMLGGASGVFSATAISPAEMVKIRMQRVGVEYKSATECLRRIVAEEGAHALFRGLPAQLARDVPFNFVFFASFDAICRTFAQFHGLEVKSLGLLDLIVSGGLAGAAGWTATLPMDVVKSRVQSMKIDSQNVKSLQLAVDVTKQIWHQAGPRGFFRGWTAAVSRAFPVNGVLFASYSMSERFLAEANSA